MSVKAFISYAHKDESHKEALVEHLATLRRNGMISEWNDRKIIPGESWKDVISANLEEAQLILFLVSSTFLASEYCFEVEFTRALEKHAEGSAQLIPIVVRPCDWKTTKLGAFQGLPKDAVAVTTWPNEDEAWLNVVDGIKLRLAKFNPQPSLALVTKAEEKKK